MCGGGAGSAAVAGTNCKSKAVVSGRTGQTKIIENKIRLVAYQNCQEFVDLTKTYTYRP